MKGKILIVDDSITQATTLKLSLVKVGFSVTVARDGIEGIALAYQTFPDLIISDIIMPEINGYQLCRVLKNDNLTKRIPIILLTSQDNKIDNFWGIKAGADSFHVKGSQITNLIEEVKGFIATTSLLSENERKRLVERKKVEATSIKSRVSQLLDQSLIESTITNEFRNLSELIHDKTFLTKGLFSLLFSILDYKIAGIFFNEEQDTRKSLYISINETFPDENLILQFQNEFFQTIYPKEDLQQSYENEIFEEKNLKDKPNGLTIDDFHSKIVIPIKYGNQILGGICLYNTDSKHYKEDQLIKLIAEELILLMRIVSLYSQTKILAITDGLTKLYNRRYFQDVYEREFSRAKRYTIPLSVVMIDIDYFKKLNDNFGHQFGDYVLIEISAMIKMNYRKTDCVARYGGEEMIVILPETDIRQAHIPTKRLKEAIENHRFNWQEVKNHQVTVSIGISEISEEIKKEQELIKQADEALYNAKRNGRNRIEIYNG